MSSKTLETEEENILPFEVGYLPQFAVIKCGEELNETPQRKMKAIQELRSLLQNNPITSGIDFLDDLLVSYLRRNKYRMKDAQRQIQNLINLQETENYVFKGVPDECLDLPSSKYMVLLPKRCQDGCALILFRWGKWNPAELPYERFRQVMVMLLGQALRDPMTQINGFKVIHDWTGVSLKITRYLTPHILLQFYNTTVNCFPARWKEIHIINQSYLMKIAWHISKPFLTDKIRNRDLVPPQSKFPGGRKDTTNKIT
ncbi:Alpha-tocopherol transfer protein-like [Araneus ventricosus]|uniref:Alpha-tocopherol transfer protein-like n=1 Tax=Araneus ventricosus TaxID=182803 RepID=A0A4Y2JGG0_ARAVE|nr:Alpha-tocopherol transfer protein-like [Araneus ventricosus]GBM88206.1 Alpha-tocopherol transfer protein-like [Araneus ventricosus]